MPLTRQILQSLIEHSENYVIEGFGGFNAVNGKKTPLNGVHAAINVKRLGCNVTTRITR